MAYVQANTTIVSTTAKSAELLTFIDTQLIAAGWVLHDTVSSTKKVYKSNGEDGTMPYYYVLLDASQSTSTLFYTVYGFWNATTHTGVIRAYGYYPGQISVNTSLKTHFVGDKNFFTVIELSSGSLYAFFSIGIVPHLYYNPKTTLTASATAGSNVNISVVSSIYFSATKYYCIVDPSNGTMERVFVSVIPSTTTLTIQTLANSYTSGSFIAIAPFNFFGQSPYGGVNEINYIDVMTPDTLNRYWMEPELTLSTSTTNIYQTSILSNIACYLTSATTLYGGTNVISGNFQDSLYPNIVGCSSAVSGDIYCVKYQPEIFGQCTSSSTTTLITDSTKSWTTNELADKIFIVQAGTGEGQIRQIASNTATTFTLKQALTTTLNTTSVFEVVEKCYIPLRGASSTFAYSIVNHDVVV